MNWLLLLLLFLLLLRWRRRWIWMKLALFYRRRGIYALRNTMSKFVALQLRLLTEHTFYPAHLIRCIQIHNSACVRNGKPGLFSQLLHVIFMILLSYLCNHNTCYHFGMLVELRAISTDVGCCCCFFFIYFQNDKIFYSNSESNRIKIDE